MKNTEIKYYEYKHFDSDKYVLRSTSNLGSYQSSVLDVLMNFEEGKLLVEADEAFMIHSKKYTEEGWSTFHSNKVSIKMTFYSNGPIDLNDEFNNGLIIPMEGFLSKDKRLSSCTGMVILEKSFNEVNNNHHSWRMQFHIYNYSAAFGEIMFELPLNLIKEYQMN